MLNKKIVSKLNSTYENENFLSGNFFYNIENTAYIYAPTYFDKYIQLDLPETFDLDNYFTNYNDYNTMKKIIKQELKTIILEENCTKEDDYYVLTIGIKDLLSRIKNVVSDLKTNDEFIRAVGSKNDVEKLLGNFDFEIFENVMNQDLIIKANSKEILISFVTVEININVNKDTYTFEIIESNETFINGEITIEGNVNKRKINLMLNNPDFGKIKISILENTKKNDKVDEIDKSKVVKYENLSEKDFTEIENKLSTSSFYTILQSIFNNYDYISD